MKWLTLFAVLSLTGCGGGTSMNTNNTPPPTPNAAVAGQYTIVQTSTKGNGSVTIYTDFTKQSDTTFSGNPNTFICPGNVFGNCSGDDAPVIQITPAGTVSAATVQITIAFTTPSGSPNTITLAGTANGTALSGTYTDTLKDAGTWTGTQDASLAGTYSGTFNSQKSPLTIVPTITANMTQDSSFNLTGTATVSNSPCFTGLTFDKGLVLGQVFNLNDSTHQVIIIGFPTGPKSFTVIYTINSAAPTCAGDFGGGTITMN